MERRTGHVRWGIAALLGAGLAFAAPIAWSIPSLIAPKGTVGSVGGIMNFLGNLAGIVAPIVAGIVADHVGFAVNFFITGAILLAGLACFLFLLGKIEQIEAPSAEISGITEKRDTRVA